MRILNQGSNGWYHALPSPPPPIAVSGDDEVEWIVIGAGCCGLAVSHRLAELRPDDRIALIEAERVGFGASGRNSGFMLSAHVHGLKTDEAQLRGRFKLWRAGLEWLRAIARDYQIQCDWSEWGRLYVAVGSDGRAHLDTLAARFRSLGLSPRRLDATEMRAATGSDHYCAGVHMDDSALIQPAALMRGLADALPENVRLFEESPVQSLRREHGRWRVSTERGSLRAPRIVLTAGVFTPELGFLKHRLVPLALYASLTRPLTALERAAFGDVQEFGLLPASAHGSTVRLTRDGRILMRNTTRYARYRGNGDDDLASVRATHRAAIAARWPELANVPLEHTWGGLMAVTRNGGSLFGEVGDGAYAVGTSDVSPVTRGTIAGRLLVDYALGQRSELLDLQLGLEPATRVPPDPLLRWVATHRLNTLEKNEAEEL